MPILLVLTPKILITVPALSIMHTLLYWATRWRRSHILTVLASKSVFTMRRPRTRVQLVFYGYVSARVPFREAISHRELHSTLFLGTALSL